MKERAGFFQTSNEQQEDIDTEERPKLGSFSLQVRRRTDQQSNFLSRTHASWYNGPIEADE